MKTSMGGSKQQSQAKEDIKKHSNKGFVDHSQDPFVIRKNAQAKATLEKHGLPKGWELKSDKK